MGPVIVEDLSDITAATPHNRVIIRACEAEGVVSPLRILPIVCVF
jgi:hypothetical protein